MKIIKTIKKALFLLPLVVLTSCGLKAVPSDYSFIDIGMENVTIDKLGNGKVLVYNGADILHKVDNTARLNVWIDGRAVGQVRGAEYVVIELKPGTYDFKVQHLDMFNMRSNHEVIVTEKTKVIRVEPTLTSNKLTVTDELPGNFGKFKYAVKR